MDRSILIIEDEVDFAQFVITGLEEEGFRVEHAVDGKQGREMLRDRPWDMVLLDWSLPHQDGLSLLRGFRQAGLESPVIFLTARDEVDDRVRGLDSGADDYLCKPFAFAELLARVRALMRRREQPSGFFLSHGDVSVDLVLKRAQRSTTSYHQVPGAGLGLSVVERIVKTFGGTVTAQSEIGRGSRFEVRLPLESSADDQTSRSVVSRREWIDADRGEPIPQSTTHPNAAS